MFTRRHYNAIVGVLQIAAVPIIQGQLLHADETWRFFRDELADLFAEDNPNFDRERFLQAIYPLPKSVGEKLAEEQNRG